MVPSQKRPMLVTVTRDTLARAGVSCSGDLQDSSSIRVLPLRRAEGPRDLEREPSLSAHPRVLGMKTFMCWWFSKYPVAEESAGSSTFPVAKAKTFTFVEIVAKLYFQENTRSPLCVPSDTTIVSI